MTQRVLPTEPSNRAQRTRNSRGVVKLSIEDIDSVAPKIDYKDQKFVLKIPESAVVLAEQKPNTAICPPREERDADGSISNSTLSSRGHLARWNMPPTTDKTITGIGTSELATAPCPILAVCCICQQSFQDGDPVRETQCHHLHHARCLEEWLSKYRARCPLCRRDIAISQKLQV